MIQQTTVNVFADMGIQPAILGGGLVRAKPSEDVVPPIVVGTSIDGLAWVKAADKGGGVVAAVEWSDDGKRWHPMSKNHTSTEGLWYGKLPPGTSAFSARAVDDSLNVGEPFQHFPQGHGLEL